MRNDLPRTLYHGTATAFEAFDLDRGDVGHPDGLGAWLTENEAEAADFAEIRARRGGEGVVLHVEQAFRNPLVLASLDELKGILRSDRNRVRETRARLLATGFDAVVIDRSAGAYADGARDVVALDARTLSVVGRVALDDRPEPVMGM